ncbi:DUF5063 domain-containing protein [Nocardioides lentus]|uniref:DUF5063 domain-containing protein n=1 Tax=Nocardioides lentus TaxID=338077 RepID=A0ABP5AGH0_9ACTN
MRDDTPEVETPPASISPEGAHEVADQVAGFLTALQTVAREGDPGQGVPLLLLEVSEVLLAGARLAVREDFTPAQEFQPDAGPDPDVDAIREELATMLGGADVYGEVFDPYQPEELVPGRLSDDLASVATDLAHGLRHFREGRVTEALWWWQYSYVASWGPEASAALRALQSVVAHDRLDTDAGTIDAAALDVEAEQLAAADEMLNRTGSPAP